MNSSRTIVLETSDGETFEVKESVVLMSETVMRSIDHNSADDNVIILPNIASKILAKVIEYCVRHTKGYWRSSGDEDEDLLMFDREFVKVGRETLFDLILAANYLKIKGLVDLTCEAVANSIRFNTQEEIRKIFRLKNLTPEEEEEIRKIFRLKNLTPEEEERDSQISPGKSHK